MAKKSKNKSKKVAAPVIQENMLPQNILLMGEPVEESKNIYISQAVYKSIHRFTKNKTTNESGGMLIGSIIEEFGKINVVISDFVEAKYCEATPTTLKFTHETWEYVHQEVEKKHKGKKIVGWIHTHPDFGIFLSEYDKFIHENFFNEEHQVAYVIDPIQNIEGFYFWINGKIERCKGFYIYDKTGVRIDINADKDDSSDKKGKSGFQFKDVMLWILSVSIVFLIFSNISTNKKLEELEMRQISTNNKLEELETRQISFEQQFFDILRQLGVVIVPMEDMNQGDIDSYHETTQQGNSPQSIPSENQEENSPHEEAFVGQEEGSPSE